MELSLLGVQNLWVFMTTAAVMILIPGPDTMYIMGRTLMYGSRGGIFSILGIFTGIMIHTTLASLGLSMILATSSVAFMVMKYLGAIYLFYLGLKMLFQKSEAPTEGISVENTHCNYGKIYRQGLFTNLSNPKASLFFLAFLPQFVSPAHSQEMLPFLLLSGLFVLMAMSWAGLILAMGSKLKEWFQHTSLLKRVEKVSGGVLVSFGIHLALSDHT